MTREERYPFYLRCTTYGAYGRRFRTWRAAWQWIRRTHNEPYCTIGFQHPTLTQDAYEDAHPELRHR